MSSVRAVRMPVGRAVRGSGLVRHCAKRAAKRDGYNNGGNAPLADHRPPRIIGHQKSALATM
jgi:hypothetical protein